MNELEERVRAAFAGREAGAVLSTVDLLPAVRTEVRRRRCRRLLGAIAAAAAMATVAAGLVVLRPAPVPGGTGPAVGAIRCVELDPGCPPQQPIGPPALTLGWLPPASSSVESQRSMYGEQATTYAVRTGGSTLHVTVTNGNLPPLDSWLVGHGGQAGQPARVQDLPATEWDGPQVYTVRFTLASGQPAAVGVTGGTRPQRREYGRQVAGKVGPMVSFLAPSFVVAAPPRGLELKGMTYDPVNGSAYTYAAPSATRPARDGQLVVASVSGPPPGLVYDYLDPASQPAQPVRPWTEVGGHRTWVAYFPTYVQFWVEGVLPPGRLLTLIGGSRVTDRNGLLGVLDAIRPT